MMEKLVSFFAMGGYYAYVWPAYGLAAMVLGGLLVVSLRALRVRQAEVDRLEGGGRRRRAGGGGA